MNNSIILPWINLIDLIHWQSNQRDTQECMYLDLNKSLNVSIIVSCCTIIEGYLFSYMKDQIYIFEYRIKPVVPSSGIEMKPLADVMKDDFIKRILNEYSDQLLQGKWSNYLKIFEIFTGVKIPKSVKPTTDEAINMLFQLRNQLVHGNEIEFEEIRDNGKMIYKPTGKYKNVVDYLLKQKPNMDIVKENRIDLLSNCVANHFYTKMIDFIKELNEKIDISQRTIHTEDLNALLSGKIEYKF